ncbi:Transmembrane protein 35 [Fasciolopsis buskii]|uniref:Novel acetylcholine receptor chaperone n=1 Tax=Fasciolopsis buskii TaxID=27845 RepID=A0A8E0RM40_9TREM|nr:Transmembrane protein 35 [Fasciolopsis buski]
MSRTALRAISVVLGIFFVFFGTLKLAPIFSEDLYRSTRKVFVKIYSSFLLSSWTGWSPSPHVVRRVYGSIEVVGGLTLAACTGLVQDLSAGVLLVLILFNLFSIWNASEGLKDASNSIVFGLLLICRFVIQAQVSI